MSPPTTAELVRLYELATKIKQTEERMRTLKMSGKLPRMKMLYSPRGEEFVSVGVGAAMRPDDYVVTTYRGLGDSIGKGVDLRGIWAEFLGKAAGPCRGKGGPMHLTDPSAGLMVTTGIVGGGIPIAVGLALGSKMQGDDRVTAVHFGDGASNIGAFHEALNMASLWKLPVVFVCHNNLYAEHTAFADGTSVDQISKRGAAYSMEALTVNGNDAVEMYTAAHAAIERARTGEGPTLLEAMTYRFWGHTVGDSMEYMPKEERKAAMAADPVPAYRTWLIDHGHATEDELAAIEAATEAEIDDALEYADAAPAPDPSDVDTDVYTEAVA